MQQAKQSSYARIEGDITLPSFRNKIINGNFDIWQRGDSIASNIDGSHRADRWGWNRGMAATVGVYEKCTGGGYGASNYSLKVRCTTGGTLGDTDYSDIVQKIEGYNIQDLYNKFITLSFYVRSNVPGIYCAGVFTGTYSWAYTVEYTINAANTWEKKEITLFNDRSSSHGVNWTNGAGLNVYFSLGSGATYQHSSINQWQNTGFGASNNQTHLFATTGNFWEISQVQLEEGEIASDFEHRPYGVELQLCQRYYEKSFNVEAPPVPGLGPGTVVFQASQYNYNATTCPVAYRVSKRVTPLVTIYSSSSSSYISGSLPYHISGVSDFANGGLWSSGEHGFNLQMGGSGNQNEKMFNWSADAEL